MTAITKTDGAIVTRDDAKLVEKAVRTIRELWTQGLLSTVVSVGDFLIETFFDGSLDLATSHSPTKPAALSQLLARVDELPISLHQLRTAIRVAAQYHALPAEVADDLTVSHHERLLLVADAARKEQIAEEVTKRGLSVRELDKLIRKYKPLRGGGRPAAPPAIKWVRGLVRAIDTEKSTVASSLAELVGKDARTVRDQILEARAVIDEMLDACPTGEDAPATEE